MTMRKWNSVSLWCCATQKMVGITGPVIPLANGLQEIQVKECSDYKDCEKARHGHANCLLHKYVQSGRW